MNSTTKILSYGTLWQENIQMSVFGRTFDIDPDMDYVSGWDIVKVKINGAYYNVAVEGTNSSIFMVAILNVPIECLTDMDNYEGLEYKRVDIVTMGGVKCQMYVKR